MILADVCITKLFEVCKGSNGKDGDVRNCWSSIQRKSITVSSPALAKPQGTMATGTMTLLCNEETKRKEIGEIIGHGSKRMDQCPKTTTHMMQHPQPDFLFTNATQELLELPSQQYSHTDAAMANCDSIANTPPREGLLSQFIGLKDLK